MEPFEYLSSYQGEGETSVSFLSGGLLFKAQEYKDGEEWKERWGR